MRNFSAAIVLGLLVLVGFASATSAQQLYTYKVIGNLGGYPVGSAINGTGQATGWSGTSDGHTRAFLWDGSKMLDLGTLGGSDSYGNAINNSGKVTGSSSTAGNAASHAFLWNGKSMIDMGTLGGTNSEGTAINTAGQITGWSDTAGNLEVHAFLWNGTKMTDLGTLGGDYSAGVAINATGQVTGSSSIPGNAIRHPFLWTGATLKDLGGTMAPVDMNNAGQVVGNGSKSGVPTGFLWDGSKMVALTVKGATRSSVSAINASGQVTGWATTKRDRKGSAYLWDGASVVKLDKNILDSSVTKCNSGVAINSNGLIVGELCNYGGAASAFLWNGFAMLDINRIVASSQYTDFYETGVLINGRGQILIRDLDGSNLNILSPIPGSININVAEQSNGFAGCQDVAGFVSSATPAPAGGLVVSLSDTLAAATVPASVTIPAGKIGAAFTIKTTPVANEQYGDITATLGAQTVSDYLDLRPMGVSAVTLTPNPVVGGKTVAGKITLECAAPANVTVTLSSYDPSVANPVPSSLVIPRGQSSATFSVITKRVTFRENVSITGSLNGIGKSPTLIVNP